MQEVWLSWKTEALMWLAHDAPRIIPQILGHIAVAFILIWLLGLVTRRIMAFSHGTLPTGLRAQQLRTVAGVIKSVGTVIIIFFAIIEILDALSIRIGPLLASAGIAGLAIGFGAQTLVKDVINGFFILMENQYDLGDTIKVSDIKGVVESMTLRRTVLRAEDGTLHIVPNSEIKIVSNLTRDWTQVALNVAVAYSEPSDRVIEVLKAVGRGLRHDPELSASMVADPEVPGIERVTSSEVDYLITVKTKPGEQYRVRRELSRRIKVAFEKNNIHPAKPAYVQVVEPGAGKSGGSA